MKKLLHVLLTAILATGMSCAPVHTASPSPSPSPHLLGQSSMSGCTTATGGNTASHVSGCPPSASSTYFVTGQTLGTLRNDYTGGVGFGFTAPSSSPPTITSLCRWTVSGNSQTHTLYFGTYISSTWVTYAQVTVNTSGATAGQYLCGAVTPYTLSPSTIYFLQSTETMGGDQFYNSDTTVTINSSFGNSETSAYSNITPPPYDVNTSGSNVSFGPVNFLAHL